MDQCEQNNCTAIVTENKFNTTWCCLLSKDDITYGHRNNALYYFNSTKISLVAGGITAKTNGTTGGNNDAMANGNTAAMTVGNTDAMANDNTAMMIVGNTDNTDTKACNNTGKNNCTASNNTDAAAGRWRSADAWMTSRPKVFINFQSLDNFTAVPNEFDGHGNGYVS